jgi:O-methyltransferase domain/Dimerisation domain
MPRHVARDRGGRSAKPDDHSVRHQPMGDALKFDPAEDACRAQLRQMILGYQLSQCICVAAKLGIADLLQGRPMSAEELATATGTSAAALGRFLLVLSSHRLLSIDPQRRFTLTRIGHLLRKDAKHSLRAAAVYWGEAWIWRPWGNLLHSLRTGAPAFDHMHGVSFFDFLARFADAGEVFDRFIAEGLHARPAAVLKACGFRRSNIIADIGGGRGAMLAAILEARPAARGILFDRPNVLESARNQLTDAGVIDRCTIVPGDFFEKVPSGADTYVLSQIIHDWDDERAISILKNCRAAMDTNSRLFVIEQLLDVKSPEPATALLDLTMLAILGGKERTADEYDLLLSQANLKRLRIIPTASPFSIVEAMPA